MLVVSRKVGEEIILADNIRLTVVAILGNRVRLGFTAPPEVPILRGELVSLTGPLAASSSSPTKMPSGTQKPARPPGVPAIP
jgi:carbon storage regulator